MIALIRADAGRLPLHSVSVDCVVTSPPYWGLRKYPDGDLGLEARAEDYVSNLVRIFCEVWRVLRPDGTLWLNLGDSYHNGDKGGFERSTTGKQSTNRGTVKGLTSNRLWQSGLKPKELVGIPWRVALALQAAGWYLRSDIIWHKPNPMPESVTDRPTKAHEYLFLLAKSERYYWGDSTEPSESYRPRSPRSAQQPKSPKYADPTFRTRVADSMNGRVYATRNIRTVWTIPIQGFSGSHWSTFPEAMARRCILAGCPPGGIVLDPFGGSGTVAKVAQDLGRSAVHVDLAYHDLAIQRIHGAGLATGPAASGGLAAAWGAANHPPPETT